MDSANLKNPPVFDPNRYAIWKTRVALWQQYTDTDPTKAAFIVANACINEIPQIIQNILEKHSADLKKDSGVVFLIKQLDTYFAKSVEMDQFDKLLELFQSRRSGQDLTSFLAEFRTKFDSVMSSEINMESLCSILLLASGDFSSHEQMLLKSVLLKDEPLKNLKVDSVCKTIKTLLVDANSSSSTDIKTESAFYSGQMRYTNDRSHGSGGQWYGNWQSDQWYSSKGKGKGKGKGKKKGQKPIPKQESGKPHKGKTH